MAAPNVNANLVRSREAAARREKMIEEAGRGGSVKDVLIRSGISRGKYNGWRQMYDDFGPRFDEARRRANKAGESYDGTFVSFRANYLRMETTWFQQQVVDAIESARPGEVTLVLFPPEHGKTTLLEDWCTYKLLTDPGFRITVGSETVDHGEKVVSRVRERFEPDGPCPEIVRDFGPIAPLDMRSNQVWAQRKFNVAGKKATDERDYSMSCVGITGRVQGTRCDLLLMDDLQDVKSIDQSQKYFDIVTQSFLSRPSMFGRTVLIGTRVGEYDVYRKLKDAQIPDHIIEIPAYKTSESVPWPPPDRKPMMNDRSTWAPEGIKFLWPHKYDQIEVGGGYQDGLHRFRYAALRFRVGEQTWWRIYMQRPEAATSMTFDSETVACMYDETRSVIGDPRPISRSDDPDVIDLAPVPVIISVDPAIGGGNGLVTAAMYPHRMDVLSVHLEYGLAKYQQIIQLIFDECVRRNTKDSYVSTVVIEDKAFQRGLLKDDRLLEAQRQFGFRIVANTTGKEKTDPDIGVPTLEMAMRRQEITIPWADELSQKKMYPLIDQLGQWRPGVNGVKLPQDLVMCLWFAYRRWLGQRELPPALSNDMSAWRTKASPLRKPRQRRRRQTGVVTYRRQRGGAGWA